MLLKNSFTLQCQACFELQRNLKCCLLGHAKDAATSTIDGLVRWRMPGPAPTPTIVLAVAGRCSPLRRPSWDRSNIVRNVILATVVEKSGHSILVFICNTCKNTCASRAAASSSNGHIDCDCAPCCAPTRGIQSAMTGDLVSHSTPCVISFGWVAYRGRN